MESIDTHQREKHSIQKRGQTAHFAFPVLLLIAWLVPAIIISQAVPRAAWHLAVFTSGWTVLFFWLLFLLIFIPGISILGPFMQKTQRQKQNWLNEYGLHILAPVTRHAGKNALVIDGGGRNASFIVYLNWQDPQTGQLYSFRVNTRYSSTLRNLPEGILYPVQFDPSDLTFFVVPRREETMRSIGHLVAHPVGCRHILSASRIRRCLRTYTPVRLANAGHNGPRPYRILPR